MGDQARIAPLLERHPKLKARAELGQIDLLLVDQADAEEEAVGLEERVLAAVGDDALVTLYDTDRWKVVRQFAWNISRLRAVCLST